jgi:predicted enzyme related to lactoylglutathione lyase
MPQNAVVWFEIYVDDMPRAKAFYEQVLDIKLEKLASPILELWAFPHALNGHGASGALAKMPGVAAGGTSTVVYFRCTDCATEANRVLAAGGRIMRARARLR